MWSKGAAKPNHFAALAHAFTSTLTTNIWFVARKPLDPSAGEAWTTYMAWANLPHLREVISLDILLCPDVVTDLIDENSEHNSHQDLYTFFFHDLNYRRMRTSDQPAHILAVMHVQPENPQPAFTERQFDFLGYDLLEEATGISALTNCGGALT